MARIRRRRQAGSSLRRSREDADAFEEFYLAHVDRVLVYFTRRDADVDLAWDLTSETFAVALEQRRRFRGTTAEEEQGWLFAIARTKLSQYHRRGRVENQALRRVGLAALAWSDAELDRVEQLADLAGIGARVREALSALPGDQAEAVRQRVVLQRSYFEIAADLRTSEQSVRTRVSRGLCALWVALPDLRRTKGQA